MWNSCNVGGYARTLSLNEVIKLFKLFMRLFKVGPSPSKKIFLFASMIALQKIMQNAFYFILKAHFVLKIFKCWSWLFGHVKKTAWLER